MIESENLAATRRQGYWITLAGVAAIVPDGLLVRLVSADDWTLLFWRGVLSAFAISVVLAWQHRGGVVESFMSIGRTGLLIVVLFAAGAFCFIFAIGLTRVANVLFIVSTAPLFAAIFSKLFLNEAVPRRVWVAIGFSLLGIALLASQSFELGQRSVLGDGLAGLAAISAAATFCLARKARATSMVPAMAVAGLLYGLIALPLATPLSVTSQDWVWLTLMGLVSVPLGFSLLTLAPRYLPAPEVSLMMLLEAVLGPLLVWLVLKEFPGVRGLIGGGLVVIALVGMNLAARRAMTSK